jgi:hypothetical protein
MVNLEVRIGKLELIPVPAPAPVPDSRTDKEVYLGWLERVCIDKFYLNTEGPLPESYRRYLAVGWMHDYEDLESWDDKRWRNLAKGFMDIWQGFIDAESDPNPQWRMLKDLTPEWIAEINKQQALMPVTGDV